MKIKIIDYRGFVKGDSNITNGSVHKVIEPPKGGMNGVRGYWVANASGEPILILFRELEVIKEKKDENNGS